MAGWIQKITNLQERARKNTHLPAEMSGSNLPSQQLRSSAPKTQSLPNATIIYGIGASLLFVAAFYLLLSARWFPALVVFALGVCLTGFALHLLKHADD